MLHGVSGPLQNLRDDAGICPYLATGYLYFCTSDGTPYVPALYRLREFCSTWAHVGCKYFKGESKTGRIFHFGLWEES